MLLPLVMFFAAEKRDWQKFWDFSLLIGILTSIIALFQQFGIMENIFIATDTRPASTIGITTALGIYLMLLSFLALSFFIKEEKGLKKPLYLASFLLFVAVSVVITQTRSAFLGFGIGFLYFFLFYPFSVQKKNLKLIAKTIVFLLFLALSFSVYFVNTRTAEERPEFIKQNELLNRVASRLSFKAAFSDPRVSGWPIALEAIKQRPVLGYGPENFAIGFDKNFDPSLPAFDVATGGSTGLWWDRAHNIFFDISAEAGIPAFLVFLSLISLLIFYLQKAKKEKPGNSVICHGLQAGFMSYLVANIFSFDVFSTRLIFFLMVAFSLHLITKENEAKDREINLKSPVLFLLLIPLLWFCWQYNLKPLETNTKINIGMHEAENKNFEKMEIIFEEVMQEKGILKEYARLQYASSLGQWLENSPELSGKITQRAYEILKENAEMMPYYTRNWQLLGSYAARYARLAEEVNKEASEQLKIEAEEYFKKAAELSPKRQETITEWMKLDFLRGKYEEAARKGEECIRYNANFRECYWQTYLAYVYLKDEKKAGVYLKITEMMYNPMKSKTSLLELVNACITAEDYERLVEAYEALIRLEPENIQYIASLAVAFKEAGETEKAREQALKVLELSPESKKSVEEFLRGLE
jgi:O-antigen ligase/tetratricopeptide (TPR) repeat protein